MSLVNNKNQPLGEVFGFPIENESERATRYRKDKLCPFNNIVSNCTKNSIDFPLGVCSIMHKESPVIVCPIRFREDWKIMSDAANFVFNGNNNWTHIGEVKLKDKFSQAVGNIDYVLVSYDNNGQIIDFASLEVQAVYISGNISGPFNAYIENPSKDFLWNNALKYPKPDFLSSSRKRLIPQILAKGTILNQWNKKQVIAIQSCFYNSLPDFSEKEKQDADLAFLVYDLERNSEENNFSLQLTKVIYTSFGEVKKQISLFEAGSIDSFTEDLQKKLDAKNSYNRGV